MLLAIDAKGRTRAPEHTGERGTCPGCQGRVDSVFGELVVPHWRHYAQSDCDPWAGGETDWHLLWKQRALEAGYRVEVPYVGPPMHRADAVSRRGHVIEFQHSGLSAEALSERSEFYMRFGPLTWVFDGVVKTWRTRWRNWRREARAGLGIIVLDEGEGCWVFDPLDERTFTATHGAVLSTQIEIASRRYWSQDIPCVTCGTPPTHTYPDGSPGYRFCLHDPVYESETSA